MSSGPSSALLAVRRVALKRNILVESTRKSSNASSSGKQFKTPSERLEYIKDANAKMEEYHKAREAMKSGKLKSKNPYRKQDSNIATKQFAIAGIFLVAFLSTPFLGRKIAQDKEFRDKYIPSWYNYTVTQERGWTRDEINAQMMQVELEVRRRAAAGEFSPEKLERLQKRLQDSGNESEDGLLEIAQKAEQGTQEFSKLRQQVWDQPNPALEKGEKYNES